MDPEHQHIEGGTLDYNYITDGIFVGTNQCCESGLVEVLQKEKITADISLEDVRLDHPFGVTAYLWLPTADGTPPTQDQLALGAKTLQELVRQGQKIYVHCKNGHGRASTLVSAYLVAQGKTPEEAFAVVKEARAGAHLQDSQRKALEEFAAHKNG